MLFLSPSLTQCCLEGLRFHQGNFDGKATLIIVRQRSVKSGVSTALYDENIKLGTLILDITENILKIGDKCQPGAAGKSSGGNYSKWPPPTIPFCCRNIQHNCLKQCLIVTNYWNTFKDYNNAIKIGIKGFWEWKNEKTILRSQLCKLEILINSHLMIA